MAHDQSFVEGEPSKRPRMVSFPSSTIVHDLEGSFSNEAFVESASDGSEFLSSDEEHDLEVINQVMNGFYSTSKPTLKSYWLLPVERDSLLLFEGTIYM